MTLRLEHAAMRAAVADVQQAHQELTEARTDAQHKVSSLLGGGWSGVAADAFAEAWQDWLTGAGQVEDGLDAMSLLLDAVHRDMIQGDDASQAALDQLSTRLIDRLG